MTETNANGPETGLAVEMMQGLELILAERKRQIEVEGYTPEHDDIYPIGELEKAGLAYEKSAAMERETGTPYLVAPGCWPWRASWWKPKGGILRQLAKAGALYAAEGELQLRRGYVTGEPGQLAGARDRVAAEIGRILAARPRCLGRVVRDLVAEAMEAAKHEEEKGNHEASIAFEASGVRIQEAFKAWAKECREFQQRTGETRVELTNGSVVNDEDLKAEMAAEVVLPPAEFYELRPVVVKGQRYEVFFIHSLTWEEGIELVNAWLKCRARNMETYEEIRLMQLAGATDEEIAKELRLQPGPVEDVRAIERLVKRPVDKGPHN